MKPLHTYTFLGALLSASLFFCLYTVPFLRHPQDVNRLPHRQASVHITSGIHGQVANGDRHNPGRNVLPTRKKLDLLKSRTTNSDGHQRRRTGPQQIVNTGDKYATKRLQSGAKSMRKTAMVWSWTLQPRVGCDDATMLVILVCSAVHRYELRDAIRATWGSAVHKRHLAVRLVFVLGKPEARYERLHAMIVNESRAHGDVLQNDIVDSYANLSLKTQAALAWTLAACAGTYFVAKTDDDVYLNAGVLLQELARMSRGGARRFMMGRLIRDAKPDADRTSKWYTPRALYANRTYPPYLSGSAYVMSTDLVDELLGAATRRKVFWLEDIYVTGLLSRDVGAQLIDSERFAYTKVPLSDPCRYASLFAAHELTPTELRTLWTQLHRPDSPCGGSSKEHFRASHAFL